MFLLYTLLILFIIHFILYYMNIDILQFRNEDNEAIIRELESSLNLLKDMNQNNT